MKLNKKKLLKEFREDWSEEEADLLITHWDNLHEYSLNFLTMFVQNKTDPWLIPVLLEFSAYIKNQEYTKKLEHIINEKDIAIIEKENQMLKNENEHLKDVIATFKLNAELMKNGKI